MAGKSLIGASIRASRPAVRRGAIALGLFAATLALAGVERSVDGALMVVLPLCFALAALINWDSAFRLDVSATALRDRRGQSIPFISIREVRALVPPAKARRNEFPIEIVHAGGVVLVPGRLTVSSNDLYDFLRERTGARTTPLPAALSAFAIAQRGTFGPDRVWSWGKRAGAPRTVHAGLRTWWIAGLMSGVLWIIGSYVSRRVTEGWFAGGMLALFVSTLLLIIDLSGRRGGGRVPPVAGLVVSPPAVALHLGDLQGQLKWDEIRGITYPATPTFLAGSSVPRAIAVDVDGARILITDSFTHPLEDIHERMLRYWRSPL